MLSSFLIGSSEKPNEWRLTKDKYDNEFIVNDCINQTIKFGKRVKTKYVKLNGENAELPKRVLISNNNKNMNNTILNFWNEDTEVINNHIDDSLFYITINTWEYRLMCYYSDYDIINTYHVRNKKENKVCMNGCSIKVPSNVNNEVIFTMDVQNKKDRTYHTLTISINDGVVTMKDDEITDEKEISTYRNMIKSSIFMNFNIDIHKPTLLTCAYIVNNNDYENVKELTKDISNAVIIPVEEDTKSDRKFSSLMEDNIVKSNIKAVTLVNVDLTKDMYKKYKISTAFNMSIDTDLTYTIECIRTK